MHIKLKKGLNIPFKGGIAANLPLKGKDVPSIDLFEGTTVGVSVGAYPVERFALAVSEGDTVSVGDTLVRNKECAEHCFVSVASGRVKKIHRGLKRRIVAIEIEPDSLENPKQKSWSHFGSLSESFSGNEDDFEKRIALLSESGLLVQIKQRPFSLLPDPKIRPRAIFINAAFDTLYSPPVQLLIENKKKHLQAAINFLKGVSSGAVHLTRREECNAQELNELKELKNCFHHTVSGPYPSHQPSVHIHHIDPIRSLEDVVWSIELETVLALGQLLCEGTLPTHRLVAICGEAVMGERRGVYRAPMGVSVNDLMAGRCTEESSRFISGDPLTGLAVEPGDFLHPHHRCFCSLKSPKKREFLHFLGLGANKFSGHLAYLSGVSHFLGGKKYYSFDTNNHGEHRAMIDGEIYQRVMPIQIPVMHLVKAVMSEDLELAQEMGLLEVEADDFALPSFICPCKTEMVSIMEKALYHWGREISA